MLKLYNFLSRQKEDFKPLRRGQVGLYTCGPTVYDFVHIGNLRTYIFEDVLRRVLEYAGYKVKQVMNITDVDDKIIRDSKKAGKNIYEFARPYEKVFFGDLAKLNIRKAHKYPRATEHIPEIIKLISKLLAKGIAYQAGGSVYFNISRFRKYGELAQLDKSGLKAGVRVDADEYQKENPQDFALWKEGREEEPSWKSPFSQGRPGWHIECSAMSMKYLGETFDIHAGAIDLLFPHHENEIAQSEAATGKKFVNYFMEAEHLLVDNQKMSKSLGNFYTLRDVEFKNYSPLTFRYLALTSHYRSRLNFTWESLEAAQNSLEHLHEFTQDILAKRSNGKKSFRDYRVRFEDFIYDDLDMPKALALTWEMINDFQKNPADYSSKDLLKNLFAFDEILGLGLKKLESVKVPAAIKKLTAEREKYRKKQDWAEADRLRQEVERRGWEIKDTTQGPRITKK